MATENTDDKILSPFYGRKKDIDPKDPEQEITKEQKAQMVEQFKSDTKTFLDKEEARIIEDVKTQKPVPALSRIEEIGEYTDRSNEQKSALLKEKSELVERKSKLESDFSQAGIALKENLQSEIEEIDRVVTDIDKSLPSSRRPGAPTPSKPQVEIPTKLPDHGIRSLYTTEERILERASRATGLPPESPTTHRIAAMLAEGDPFSAESFERARQESIKLFKAGLVPHPDYDESFGKEIAEFLDWANPAAVEILGTLGTAVVTSPLLAAPEPTTKATWYGINSSSAAFWNYIAQIMEVGSGKREEVRWSEVFASGAVGAISGSKIVKDASKLQIMTRRGLEGAGQGAGFEAVKLGFDALYGDQTDTNFIGAAGLGGVIGALLGRWENAFVIYEASASEQGAAYLRKMLTDELKQLKREAKRDPKVYLKFKEKIAKKEVQLKELIPTEEQVTQRAIDALEQAEKKQMEEVAKVAEAFKKTEAFKLFQDIDVEGTGAAVSTGVPGVLPKQLAGAKPRYNYGDRNIELNFENDIAKALYIAGIGQSSKRKQEYIDWLKSQGVEDVEGLAKQVRDGIKSQAKAGQDSVFIKSPFKFVEPPAPKPTEAAQEVEPDIQQKARDILDDFMGGGGTREVDPLTGKVLDSKDEVKARLLTTDEEKRRLINVVTQVMDQDLKNVKGGRVGQLEYLAQVQNELSRRLGPKASQELGIVLNSAQVTDNFEVADAIRKLGIHMSANGAVMVQGYDDLIKFLDNADLNDINVVNDATASIIKLIPQQLAWKQAGAESGRLLQARKYTKDILTEQQKKVLAGLEGKLVKDVKEAKDLTEEQLDEQIKTFGDIQVVKKLLQTIQQADDTAEVHQILMDQQKSFQKTWKEQAKEYLADPLDPNKKIPYLQDPYTGEAPTAYSKVRDMARDVIYFKMLNNPVTHAKVLTSNTVMSNYNVMNGWIGAKFMATLPWTKEGISKQEWQRAGDFWQRVGASYGTFGAIANKEALKALKSGESDLQTHFERFGKSAFSMERTGLSGPLGATLENVGRGVDMPGASMAALDVRTRLNLAHAMTRAKAEIDYQKAVEKGEQVGTFQEYYNKFVGQVFTESKGKLMTEDQVRRKAVLMADKEGVAPENLASYMDNFVKQNWNKDISEFVNYIQRNLKEVTFTEEIGEFADPNVLEKGNYFIEQFIRTYPLLNVVLNPFMRTGRNIQRGAAAVTSPLLSLSRSIDKIPGANKIPGIKDVPRVAERLWTKTAKDLASDDPIVAARARGQQISSVGILLTAYGLAEGIDGLVQFVGTESQDWRMKKAIRTVTGMPEYTLRIADPTRPGKMKAISLAALEPFNTILSVTADMKSLSSGTVAQREEARNLFEAFTLALANNLTNKSYYKNLGDAMKLITEATADSEVQRAHAFRMLKGIAGQTVSAAQNALTYMSDDIIRENSNLMQVIARRMNGLSKLVPPMRDIFGDIQTRGLSEKRTGGLEILSPFGVFNERGDIDKYIEIDEVTGFRSIKIPKITKANVAQELRADKKGDKLTDQDIELAYQAKIREAAYAVCIELGVAPQFNGGTTKWEGIDLQEIRDPETQQDAFDRWQELANEMKLSSVLTPSKKGKTMKEAIVELASGGGYMSLGRFDYKKDIRKAPKTALPEGEEQKEDERIPLIKNVFKVYRDQALIQLKKEFPILEGEVESREEFQEELNKPFKPKSSMESEADYQKRLQKRREFELGAKETEFPAEQYQEQQVPSKLEELMLPFRN